MSTYLDKLRDAARERNRAAAIRLINSRGDGRPLNDLAFLNGKSDDYVFARLDALTRGEENPPAGPARLDANGRLYREDTDQRNLDGYGRPIYGAHRGDGAAAEDAAYRASVERLNAGRNADGRIVNGAETITAAEKAAMAERLGRENEPSGEPSPSLVKRAERRQAIAARKALEEMEPDLEAAKAEAEAALKKANARLNAGRKDGGDGLPGSRGPLAGIRTK